MSIRNLVATGLLAASIPTAALAQPESASTTPIDEARLASARDLIEVFFPSASREQMLNGMMTAINANMRNGIMQSEMLKGVLESKPAAGPVVENFLAEEALYARGQLGEHFPQLLDAMAMAYARRFTLAQLGELRSFFATPTGALYVRESMTILSDPDIARVQSVMMAESMDRLPTRLPELIRNLKNAGVLDEPGGTATDG